MKKTIEKTGIPLPPEIKDDFTRREFLIGAGLLTLAPACGSDEGSSGETTSANTRTIEHKYGSTEVSGAPRRVVTVGLTDHDAALALGVVPVGLTAGDYATDQPFGVWPWARGELGDGRPEVLPDTEFNFERIAALEPDLIIGAYSGMTADEYETLSEIAPTVAQSGEYADYGTPWQEMTRTVGHALRRRERAEELVAGVDARFDEARESHPEFQGATAMVATTGEDALGAYGPQHPAGRFLTSLGFETPDEIVELTSEAGYAEISGERLDLVDTDALVWLVAPGAVREDLENAPLYQRLDVYSEGRYFFLDEFGPLASAMSFSTVLSLPYALDEIVPMLAAAIDGDPETEATE